MDYKEKYLNALEKAREICDTECFYDKRTIESIFPELENKKEWSDCDTNIVKEIKVLINELASKKKMHWTSTETIVSSHSFALIDGSVLLLKE